MADAAKKKEVTMGTKIRFNIFDDLELLKDVIALNPFRNSKEWENIAKNLTELTQNQKVFSARNCKEHTDLLLKLFRNQDLTNLRKSGCEEQYNLKESMLQQAEDMRREWLQKKPAVVPKAARNLNVGKNRREMATAALNLENVPIVFGDEAEIEEILSEPAFSFVYSPVEEETDGHRTEGDSVQNSQMSTSVQNSQMSTSVQNSQMSTSVQNSQMSTSVQNSQTSTIYASQGVSSEESCPAEPRIPLSENVSPPRFSQSQQGTTASTTSRTSATGVQNIPPQRNNVQQRGAHATPRRQPIARGSMKKFSVDFLKNKYETECALKRKNADIEERKLCLEEQRFQLEKEERCQRLKMEMEERKVRLALEEEERKKKLEERAVRAEREKRQDQLMELLVKNLCQQNKSNSN